ncbi:hypothetical protein BS50DRAFT_568040 [Corynespora cassiicola Philippines]|uniref:BRCT domain-containing protein n=1 Tax=Corynespora cassiicola Philippines TaxID=1448308 RepID=A0A2T2PCK3_CORCC|nr:hypothetical protein BS50DRAFT_568040 [Corynespora cassiicola Philippines]
MEAHESQEEGVLRDSYYNDPSQLSLLLQRHTGTVHSLQFTVTSDGHPSPTKPSAFTAAAVSTRDAPPQSPAAAPHPGPRRVTPHPQHVNPSLITHHTAPTPPVTERIVADKMFNTFGNAMDFPGDTQPDSQLYKNFTSAVHADSHQEPVLPSLLNPIDEDTTDAVDTAESSQLQDSPHVTSPTVILGDRETQLHAAILPTSPIKFETPANAGRKRNNEGQLISSAIRTATTTPGTNLSASAFFDAGDNELGHGMSLTQAFNATQAKTSPVVGGPAEDPVFQRPSPTFAAARNSSPVPFMSSPIKQIRNEPLFRSSSEPRTEYITMRESQEMRGGELRIDDTSAAAQDSWDEPSETEKRFRRRKAKERFDQEAAKSLATVSAPCLTSVRQGKARRLLSMNTNYHNRTSARPSHRRTYDGPFDDEEGPLEDEPTDSPDELSQHVPSSARVSRAGSSPLKTDKEARIQVPHTSSHQPGTLSGRTVPNSPQRETPSSQVQQESQVRFSALPTNRFSRPKSSKETETVMDSQPDATAEMDSLPRPKPLRFPSSPSTNQYSVNQTTMDRREWPTSQRLSSPPPMPPKSSPGLLEDEGPGNEGDEERVPSSPPVIAQDDDIVYDEHAYDEHSEPMDGGSSTNEDADVTEDEGDGEVDPDGPTQPDRVPPGKTIGDGVEQWDRHETRKMNETADGEVTHAEEVVRSSHPEDEVQKPSSGSMRPPLLKRQSTIPESDMLEETQPSYFLESETTGDHSTETAQGAEGESNNAQDFHTAQEALATFEPKDSTPANVESTPHVRSLKDIASLPQTQLSTDTSAIEMPQLFSEGMDDDMDTVASASSAGRAFKKRKITYSAKKKGFDSAVKETDPLSEPPTSPLKHAQHSRDDIAHLATEQEQQSALATEAHDETMFATPATLKAGRPRKTAKPRSHKKGALQPVKQSLFRRSPDRTPARSKPHQDPDENAQPIPETPAETSAEQAEDVEMHDAAASVDTPDELAGPTPAPELVEDDEVILETDDRGEAPTGELVHPHRVLAYWPGNPVFYPATCLGHGEGQQLRVRYDDGNIHPLDPTQVRAFDLQIGDQVKVDEKGMKKHIYVVVGFRDKQEKLSLDEFPTTDRRGYATVVLEEKQRDSLPQAQLDKAKQAIAVPMGKIYLTNQLWLRYRNRAYTHTSVSSPSAPGSEIETPKAEHAVTPATSRRGLAPPSFLKSTTTRAGSVASSVRSGAGIFSNMAFAVTLTTSDDAGRQAYKKLIKSNGGQVLENGFHELFDYDSSVTTSFRSSSQVPTDMDDLILKDEFKDLGFVAVISDAHCRTGKFIQALALNIPCLHTRWIQDSLASSCALSFAKYVLPAGLSTYLSPTGVLRSRILDVYDPDEEVTFAQMIKGRELLLQDQAILMFKGKTKKEQADRHFWTFIAHALGPATVERCVGLAEAKNMLKDGAWDYVYVDGAVEEAAHVLLGHAKPTAGRGPKKPGRKKKVIEGEDGGTGLVRSGKIGGKNVRVVGDEFIIQSLILGALAE